MRILFCNKYNFPFSGTEVYLLELINLLRTQGHGVALFSMEDSRGEPTPYDPYFVPHIDFKNPTQSLVKRASLAAHAIYSTEARRRLRAMISVFRPDLAHVRNIYHHLSPSILWELKAQAVPVLYHINDFKVLCPTYNLVARGNACAQPCTGNYWKVITEKCYAGEKNTALVLAAEAFVHHWLGTYRKCIDHFLAPSRFAKDLLVQHGFDAAKITVLPHFQRLPAAPSPPQADAPVLYFGRLSPEKGVTDLLLAMRDLPQVRLQIAGDGPQKAELKTLAGAHRLNNVEFMGHLEGEQLDHLIAASRFTVLPSRAYETLGKSILESYAWQKPVVATDLGSRRELVHEHETGMLYPPGNVEALRDAIWYLGQRPQLAAEMGAAGRKFVESRHSPESHYRELMGLYEQMCTLARKPRAVAAPARQPLRVAFIGGRGVVSKYSGIESYYEEAGKELVRLGYEVTVYCRSYFTPPIASHHGMRLVRLPTIRSKHLETLAHTTLSTIHALFGSCDIVHYHALGPALFSFLPRLVGKKTVVTVQGLDWQRKKWGRVASWVLRLGERASARLPDATLVVSRTLQDHYRRRYAADTTYVPNGTVIRGRSAPRKVIEWGLAPGKYILFLGRFSPEKNCHLLIDAFERLETSAKLVLAGGSSHTGAYADELRKHQGDRIAFLDWVSGTELDELLTNTALFVLPSDLEGLSLALLDAMGAGVCVLTSDIPENREVVEDAGFTFRAGDVDDLGRMLGLLLSDATLRAEAGAKAKQRIQERYLWPQIAQQIGGIYDELACHPAFASKRPPAKAPAEAGSQTGRVA